MSIFDWFIESHYDKLLKTAEKESIWETQKAEIKAFQENPTPLGWLEQSEEYDAGDYHEVEVEVDIDAYRADFAASMRDQLAAAEKAASVAVQKEDRVHNELLNQIAYVSQLEETISENFSETVILKDKVAALEQDLVEARSFIGDQTQRLIRHEQAAETIENLQIQVEAGMAESNRLRDKLWSYAQEQLVTDEDLVDQANRIALLEGQLAEQADLADSRLSRLTQERTGRVIPNTVMPWTLHVPPADHTWGADAMRVGWEQWWGPQSWDMPLLTPDDEELYEGQEGLNKYVEEMNTICEEYRKRMLAEVDGRAFGEPESE